MNISKTFSLAIYLLMAGLTSCTQSNSPRPVAEKFLSALQNRDFDEAKKFSTKETVKLLQVLERISREDTTQSIINNKIEIISEEISGNKAIVYFKESGNDTEQKLLLRKVETEGESEKQWKVVLTKEDANLNKRK